MPCIVLEMFFKRLQIDFELKLIFPVGQNSVDANCQRHLVPAPLNGSVWEFDPI